MNHLSTFNGIGGFQLAAHWVNWNNIAHIEIDDICNKIVAYHFPESKCHLDIKEFNGEQYNGTIDIISGGFPCQPFSNAGKRLGTEDDRNLWPEMYRVIQEVQPSYVVAENVGGIINWNRGLVFEQIHLDLEASGYEVQSFILPAVSVNAPHRRDRVWIVANSKCDRKTQDRCSDTIKKRRKASLLQEDEGWEGEAIQSVGLRGLYGVTTNSNGTGRKEFNTSTFSGEKEFNGRDAVYTDSTSKQGKHIGQKGKGKSYRPNNRDGINGWETFPTQSPICSGNDGLSDRLDNITFPKWRNESIKAYGNAIVPQVAYEIFKVIDQYDKYSKYYKQ